MVELNTKASRRKHHILYKTTCIMTGKFYIGMHSTDDLDDGYLGSGQYISRSIKKHGKENHVCEVLEMLPTRKSLREREREVVNEELLKDPLCMNLIIGGNASEGHSLTTREKMRLAKLGSKRGPSPLRGRKLTDEHKQKISTALEGHASWSLGQTRTEEVRMKLSKASKGRTLSAEARQKISKTLMGHPVSDESRKKMSETKRLTRLRRLGLA